MFPPWWFPWNHMPAGATGLMDKLFKHFGEKANVYRLYVHL
jgi:hypothetical protein